MRTHARGVALVMAMGVVALAAMVATAILVSLSTWSRQSELTADHAQAQQLIQAGGDWARAVLYDDRRATGSIDQLGEPWALRLQPIPVDNGELLGQINDQQGLFNLNNLVTDGKLNPQQYARFQRLLGIVGVPVQLADVLVDWIDADHRPQAQNGAEDAANLAQYPPSRPPNQPLIDVDELAQVRGFDADVRARLAPFVTALPAPTAVNVNTAPAEVLAALVNGLGIDAAHALVERRATFFYRSNADFSSQLGKGITVPDNDIRVGSDYFLASMRVSIGGAQVRGKILFSRQDAKRWPTIVWRKYQ